jgi:excinuclease ABC subunit A
MQRLRDAGNSLLVVEHDPQVMLAADRILDIGPGPGRARRRDRRFGTPDALVANARARSPATISPDASASRPRLRVPGAMQRNASSCVGAGEHNLKGCRRRDSAPSLVCVTGVSGSGKSTLVQDVLHAALLRAKGKPTEAPGAHRALVGAERIDDVVLVDQTPIGRTTRSNPGELRRRIRRDPQALRRRAARRERGYTQGTFSFNAGTGRCPTCGGNGFEHVENAVPLRRLPALSRLRRQSVIVPKCWR